MNFWINDGFLPQCVLQSSLSFILQGAKTSVRSMNDDNGLFYECIALPFVLCFGFLDC